MREVMVRSSESLQERTADKHIYTTRQPVLVCAILAQWHGAHTGTSVAARTGYGHMHQLVTVPEAAEPFLGRSNRRTWSVLQEWSCREGFILCLNWTPAKQQFHTAIQCYCQVA